jgi:hypothetical protein
MATKADLYAALIEERAQLLWTRTYANPTVGNWPLHWHAYLRWDARARYRAQATAELGVAPDLIARALTEVEGLLARERETTAALSARLAVLETLREIVEAAATETYMGANAELLLMAKGRALDRLIAAWERSDHERAATRREQGR